MENGFNIDDFVDIKTVRLNYNLPEDERYLDFIRQLRNPYYCRNGEYIIRFDYKKLLPPYEVFEEKWEQCAAFERVIAEHIKQADLRVDYSFEKSSEEMNAEELEQLYYELEEGVYEVDYEDEYDEDYEEEDEEVEELKYNERY